MFKKYFLNITSVVFLVATLVSITVTVNDPLKKQIIGTFAKLLDEEEGGAQTSKKQTTEESSSSTGSYGEESGDCPSCGYGTVVTPQVSTQEEEDEDDGEGEEQQTTGLVSNQPGLGQFGWNYTTGAPTTASDWSNLNANIAGTYVSNGKRYLVDSPGTFEAAQNYTNANPGVNMNLSGDAPQSVSPSSPTDILTAQEKKVEEIECLAANGTYDKQSGICATTQKSSSGGTSTNTTTYVDVTTGDVLLRVSSTPTPATTSQERKVEQLDCAGAGGSYNSSLGYCTTSTQSPLTDGGSRTVSTIVDMGTGQVLLTTTQTVSNINKIDSSGRSYITKQITITYENPVTGKTETQTYIQPSTYDLAQYLKPEQKNFADCNREGLSEEQTQKCNERLNFAYNLPLIGDYIKSYAPSQVEYSWQKAGYNSLSECQDDLKNLNPLAISSCNTYQVSKEQAIASISLGSSVTAAAFGAAALPAGIYTGATAGAGAGIMQFFTGLQGATTLHQTSNAVISQIYDPGSKQAWKDTGLAALSWANATTADLLIKGVNGAKTANSLITVAYILVDTPEAISQCSKESNSFYCGGAIAAVASDVLFAGIDYKQGQLGFDNPFKTLQTPSVPRITQQDILDAVWDETNQKWYVPADTTETDLAKIPFKKIETVPETRIASLEELDLIRQLENKLAITLPARTPELALIDSPLLSSTSIQNRSLTDAVSDTRVANQINSRSPENAVSPLNLSQNPREEISALDVVGQKNNEIEAGHDVSGQIRIAQTIVAKSDTVGDLVGNTPGLIPRPSGLEEAINKYIVSPINYLSNNVRSILNLPE